MTTTDCPACDGLGCIPASPGERARICLNCDGWAADEKADKRNADALADQAADDEAMGRER